MQQDKQLQNLSPRLASAKQYAQIQKSHNQNQQAHIKQEIKPRIFSARSIKDRSYYSKDSTEVSKLDQLLLDEKQQQQLQKVEQLKQRLLSASKRIDWQSSELSPVPITSKIRE
ncbi:Hypothetical_protein [Hexamita inflata]|uniref:Hypothetical_protein n=1 Tax=Hexamita inflata TaxID=28002 RepID=A0AA86NI90_9EUKA|nr:Hypothetical protein HINF_LOCUS7355 [Hexamita inflata]CAI9972094.1 Hypothetical protein HINF_LOCUS59739 [Hexamita inflata]